MMTKRQKQNKALQEKIQRQVEAAEKNKIVASKKKLVMGALANENKNS